MYAVGENIFYPMHGAGVIEEIKYQTIASEEVLYYVIRTLVGNMMIMVPVATAETVGLRPVIGCTEADALLSQIPTIEIHMTTNWNQRYRENVSRIKSGDLMEVATVIKGLYCRECERGLSTGERKMLHSARQILTSEIVCAKGCCYEDAEKELTAALVG